MSVKLGTLTLDLVTKIGNFVGPINEAESKLTKSFSKMRDSVNSFGLIAVSAGAGATAALIAMADNMAKHNAELERFAYLAQTSVAEFQKMSVGAKMMGIEADKLSDIMKDWNERFGDFLTAGSGPLVDFMEQVAVKTEKGADGAMKLAKELSKLSGPESMGLFVKKMEEANLSQDQMSFLMESMASDSTLLLPLLKNNAEGMRLWGEAAERAGIIMDDKTRKASRELQVQTQMLDMQYEGLKKQLLSAVIPALVDVSEAMLDGDKNARGMADAGDVLATSLRGVAAIGIGVYATLNLIANAMAGIAKSAVDSYQITQKAAESGSWYDKLPGIKLLKGGLTFGVTASAENSGIGMALADNAKVLEDAANKINGLFDTTVSTATAKLAALQGQVNQTNTAATQGAKDWLDKQNKATEATKAATQAQNAQNKAYQDAVKLAYDYGTEYQRIEHDLTNEIKTIRESALDSGDKTKMIAEAKSISEARKKVYLLEYEQDVDAWNWSEDQKLAKHIAIEKARVIATKGMSKEERQVRLDSFERQLKQEQAWLELEKQQRLFSASETFYSEAEAMKERYRLERDEIEKLKDQKLKIALLEALKAKEIQDAYISRTAAARNLQGVIGINTDAEQERESRDSALRNAYENDILTQEQFQDAILASEQLFYMRRLEIQAGYAASIAGSTATMFKTIFGESSKAYAAMFALEKGFAIGQAALALAQNIAMASKIGFPQNLPMIAGAVAQGAQIASIISSAASPQVNGYANGGYTGAGGKYDPAGIVHKGEVVFSQVDVARWGGVGNVEALRTGKGFADGGVVDTKVLDTSANSTLGIYLNDRQGSNTLPNVNVYTLPGTVADVGMNSNGELEVRMRQISKEEAMKPWNDLSRANSEPSRAIQQNFSVARNR